MCKIMNFKAKKGKNKYNVFEQWIKKVMMIEKSILQQLIPKP